MNAYKVIWGQSNVVILFLDCEAGSHVAYCLAWCTERLSRPNSQVRNRTVKSLLSC